MDLPQLLSSILADLHPEYHDAGILIRKYLDRVQSECTWKHDVELAGIDSPEAFEKLRKRLKAELWRSLGVMPTERTPLEPKITGVIERDTFRIEKLVLQSRPNFHVTANLWLPTSRSGPVPGVVVPCGHLFEAKAALNYHSVAQFLALKGYAALCFDPVGQGERLQYPDESGKSLFVDPVYEHCMSGNICFLAGFHLMGFRIWDAMRMFDYLESRPEVDSERLGVTGNSGGGTEALWLTPLEPRIKVAVPEGTVGTWGGGDAEQNLPSDMLTGVSHAAMMCMAFPRPYRLIKESRGGVHTGSLSSFQKAKWLYTRLGEGEKISVVETVREHGYYREMREPMIQWMNRWLGDPEAGHTQPELEVFSEQDLRVTPTGQVSTSYGSDRVIDFCLRHLQEQLPEGSTAGNAPSATAAHRSELARRIRVNCGIVDVPTPSVVAQESAGSLGSSTVTRLIIESEPEVYLPVLMAAPSSTADGKPAPTVVLCDDRGKSANGGALFQSLAESGQPVIAVDLRGYGETKTTQQTSRDKAGPWQAQLLGVENLSYAYGARHTGHTVIGMRILDLLQTVRALPGLGLSESVLLVGHGSCGLVALHAATMLEDLSGLCLWRTLTSYREVAEGPLYRVPFYDMVPNALEDYDLPDLVEVLDPAPVRILNPVDPMLESAAADRASTVYGQAADVVCDERDEPKAVADWIARLT